MERLFASRVFEIPAFLIKINCPILTYDKLNYPFLIYPILYYPILTYTNLTWVARLPGSWFTSGCQTAHRVLPGFHRAVLLSSSSSSDSALTQRKLEGLSLQSYTTRAPMLGILHS